MSKRTGQVDDRIDAFISYQSEDEEFARKLATKLESYSFNGRRLKVFFAPWDIEPGTNIILKIEEALEKARFFLIILSPKALEAEWPTAERAAAIYNDPSGRLGRVIPILRKPCRIPPLLRFRNYIDFRDDNRFEAELTRLLCVLLGQPLPRGSKPVAIYKSISQRKAYEKESPLRILGESWKPDPVAEEVCSNLFLVKELPPKIWSAPCFLRNLKPYFGPEIIPPHILKEKRLFTFIDLSKEDNFFSGVIEDYDVKSVDVERWFGDDVHSRWLVELLNQAIENHCSQLRLSFDPVGKRYYYTKDAILKEIKWTPYARRATKKLLTEYKNYVAHRAVRLKFEVIDKLVFLKINTGWVFTWDGYHPIRDQAKRSSLATKFLARQKNLQNFSDIRFWAWLLSENGKTIVMDLGGGVSLKIDTKPLSTSIIGGIFGDRKKLPKMTRGPPRILKEQKGVDRTGAQ